jgi:3-deoxy-D-manno-octulosonate 8-phosphate phosphatase KdsC-like HAD superfamily phosphatase/ABC-type proline/glycine betaine transport system permease subunit
MKELFKLAAVITMEGLEGVRNGLNAAEKEAKKLSKTLVQTGQKIESVGSKMSMMITLPVAAATAGILKLTDGASDLSETISKSQQIFGDAAKQIDEWSNSSATAFGQSKKQAIDAASTFAIFGKSAGKTGDDLVRFSTQFTALASDFASFYNTSPEDAITAIGAAFRGENEPIRRYGILLDDASMRQEALRLGIVKTIKEALTPQQKVLAASALIMKQSSDAQGDFARTSKDLENQKRILAAEIKNLADGFGKEFIPVALRAIKIFRDEFLPILKNVAKAIKETPPEIKNFAIGMSLAAAAIGPLLLGLGKALVLFKDLQIVIKSLNVLLLGNPFGIAALAITGIAIAVGKTVSAWQKWKAEIGQKVQNKQVEQMKKDLEELIPLYNELALGQDVAARGEENFIAVNKRIKELETNLADLGYEFTGSFINKSIQAEDVLTDLNLTTDETANIVDDLTTKINENTDSTNTNADAVKALEEEQAKLLERRRQTLEGRSALEDEYANKVFEQNANDIELLDKKYREELLRAEELGADKLNIEKWYQTEKQRIIDQATYEHEQDKNKEVEEAQKTADRIAEIDKELAETRNRLEREVAEERMQQTWGVFSFISDSFNQLGSILSGFNSDRLDEIDQWEARQREEIENSMLSEEEKDAKLQALEDEAAKREQDAKRRQAKQNKAIGIFNIIISTAQAIMKAWTELPWYMAAIQTAVIGTLGTAQAAVVAAQPIPLAKGGFVESVPGGVNTIVGEGRQDELVLPLETGVDMMVKKLVEGIGSTDRAISPASAIGSTTYVTENHYHIGTLVGDDSGYKQLERRLEPYRTSELSRRGQ